VKAGLIPRLRDPKETTEQWSILQPIRPGKTPLQALNNALKEAQLPEVKPQTHNKIWLKVLMFGLNATPTLSYYCLLTKAKKLLPSVQTKINARSLSNRYS
jgi:hypothetical protein